MKNFKSSIKNLLFLFKSKSNFGSPEEKLGDVRDGYILLKKAYNGTNTYAYLEDLALEQDRYIAFSTFYSFPKVDRWISSVTERFDVMIVFSELDCKRSTSNPSNLIPIRKRIIYTQYFIENELIQHTEFEDIKLWMDMKDFREDSYEKMEADFICSKIKP